MTDRGQKLVLAGICSALWLLAGCGYTFGPTPLQDVRTIHVPVFTTDTARRNFDYLLTEAVQQEIRTRGGYRLTDLANADTVLEGKVVDIRKNVLSESRFDDPRELQIMLGAQISWIDRRNGRILQQQMFPISQELAMQASQASFAPEVGQSLATAQHDAVRQLAARIVDLTEMPW